MGQARLRGSREERIAQAQSRITDRHRELAKVFGTTARRIESYSPSSQAKLEQEAANREAWRVLRAQEQEESKIIDEAKAKGARAS